MVETMPWYLNLVNDSENVVIYCSKSVSTVRVAQWIVRLTSNPEAAGSNPAVDVFLFYLILSCSFSLYL